MQQIRKNVLYNVLLNVARVLFPLVTAPYVARVLEPEGVGLFDFANTYAGFFAMVALLGIPTYGVREVARRRDDSKSLQDTVSQLFSVSLLTTALVTVVYLLTLLLVHRLTADYLVFLLAGATLYFAPFRIEWYYQGMEEFGYITLRSLIIKTLSVICLFIFVRTKADLLVYVLLNALSTVSGDMWNFCKMVRSGIRPRLTLHGLRPHMRPILLLFASSLAISVYTMLDTEMLGFMKSDYTEVAYYNRAVMISRILLAAVTSLSIVVIPRVAQSAAADNYLKIEDIVNKSFSVISFLAVPMSVGIACIAPVFVPLFYGPLYEGAVLPLMITGLLITIIGFSNLTTNQILIGMGHDGLFLRSVLWGAFSNVLLNLLLIPRFGAVGASVASVIAESLVLSASVCYAYRNTPIRIHLMQDLWKVLAGAALFVPMIVLFRKILSGWLLVLVFVGAGFVVYVLVQCLLHHSAIELLLPALRERLTRRSDHA